MTKCWHCDRCLIGCDICQLAYYIHCKTYEAHAFCTICRATSRCWSPHPTWECRTETTKHKATNATPWIKSTPTNPRLPPRDIPTSAPPIPTVAFVSQPKNYLPAMWQFLALLSTMTSPLAFFRKTRQRLQKLEGPSARPWAARPLDDPPYYATRRGLEIDLWHARRDDLSFDYWADHRAKLNTDRLKTVIRGVPERRTYVLEELDGGESLDGVNRRRGRPSPNARAFRIGSEDEVEELFGKQR